MKQRINIYIEDLALAELDKLTRDRGLSRGKVVEELVMGARDVDERLKALEAGQIIQDQPAVAFGQPDSRTVPPGGEDKNTAEPPKSGPKVKARGLLYE